VNRLELNAQVQAISVLRYSPSGLPVLDFLLLHESTVIEAGQSRKIQLTMKSIALGVLAERISRFELGSTWLFHGFLGSSKNLKSVIYHIQEIHTDS
jgi:primosomal replication protein N